CYQPAELGCQRGVAVGDVGSVPAPVPAVKVGPVLLLGRRHCVPVGAAAVHSSPYDPHHRRIGGVIMSSPPNAYQAKFTGLEFAAGTLRGVRVWTIQPTFSQRDGHRLVGSYHGVWHEGENHAKCLVNQDRLPTSEQREPCTLVEPSCQCGFYAYWTWRPRDYGYTAFYYAPYVAGVIEGYGKTVMGSLGFRRSAEHTSELQSRGYLV